MKRTEKSLQRAKLISPASNSLVVENAEKELAKLEAKKMLAKQRKKRQLKAKKKGKISSRVPPVEVSLDGPEFTPQAEDGFTWLIANVPVAIDGNRRVALGHRGMATVDCGFSAKVPEGYKLVIELSPDLREHGLEVYKNTITSESRVNLSVRNVGREVAVVNHRDRVALLRIEPIYPLTFKVME